MQSRQLLTIKGERTFLSVLESAIHLFQTKGFEKTSMRDISKSSGLALGAIYYYCRSKEELVFHFYQRINDQVFASYDQRFDPQSAPKDLGAAFAEFVQLKLAKLSRHRKLLIVILKESFDPESPISPFNRSSAEFRDRSIDVFEKLIHQYRPQTKDAAPTAKLLWLAHLAIIAFWLYDRSDKHSKTDELIQTTASLINWSDALAALPGVKQMLTKMSAVLLSLIP